MFKSFFSRRRKPESRIHKDLTSRAKERISSITNFAEDWHMKNALKELEDEAGIGEIRSFFAPHSGGSGFSAKNTHNKLISSASKEIVFSYLEYLLRVVYNAKEEGIFGQQVSYYSSSRLIETLEKLKEVLVSEGILWELKGKKGELGDCYFEFHELASVMQKDSDEELQKIYLGTEWEECLKGYNEAYVAFLSGASFIISEKLYCSFDDVAKKISSEQGWKMGKKIKLSAILEKMKEENILGDKSLFIEVNDLLNLLVKHSSKLGGDRKRHKNIDKYFCNLLLHQSSAWITYIIKKYEEFRKK